MSKNFRKIFDDADIDNVIESMYINKFTNSGQICDGQKRLIVHSSKIDEVLEKFKKCIESKNIGNPLNEETEIGPLVSKEQLEKFFNTEIGKKSASLLANKKNIRKFAPQ